MFTTRTIPSLCSCRSLEEVQYPSCSLAPFLCALCVPCGRQDNRCARVRNSIDILQLGVGTIGGLQGGGDVVADALGGFGGGGGRFAKDFWVVEVGIGHDIGGNF